MTSARNLYRIFRLQGCKVACSTWVSGQVLAFMLICAVGVLLWELWERAGRGCLWMVLVSLLQLQFPSLQFFVHIRN